MRHSPDTSDHGEQPSRDNFRYDMFSDSEDLLHQLSSELGLPELMDDDDGSGGESPPGGSVAHHTLSLYDQLLADSSSLSDDSSIFSDIMQHETLLSPDTLTLKTEPFSPSSQCLPSPPLHMLPLVHHHHLPPSPSSSEGSGSNGYTDYSTSPPCSPPASAAEGLLIQQQYLRSPVQVISKQIPLSIPPNHKLPIPKVQRPAPVVVKAQQQPQPLILTSAQLAQLTKSGVFRVATTTASSATSTVTAVTTQSSVVTLCSQQQPVIIKTEQISPMSTGMPTMHTIPMGSISTNGDGELKSMKRQQRMIKNRESACLSRKKKKEYVTSLEEQLSLAGKENHQLRQENEVLRTKVRELESEKILWMDTVLNGSNLKKGTALFALLFVISLNFSSLSGLYQNSPITQHSQGKVDLLQPSLPASLGSVKQQPHVGRSLLWANGANETSADDDDLGLPPNMGNSSLICPMYYNQSESLRLDSQLRGWFKLDPFAQQQQTEDVPAMAAVVKAAAPPAAAPRRATAAKKGTTTSTTSLGHYARPAVQSLTGGIYHMLINEPRGAGPKANNGKDGGEMTLFNSETVPRFTYEAFFEAIDRNDDTFYVVSFSGDHLLLPASAHNQTSRPRMSLLLPTLSVPLNESMRAPANHVAMMQIDCEVMNTRLIYINEDAIPIHMSANMRESSSTNNNNASVMMNETTRQFKNQSRDLDEGYGGSEGDDDAVFKGGKDIIGQGFVGYGGEEEDEDDNLIKVPADAPRRFKGKVGDGGRSGYRKVDSRRNKERRL